MKAKKILLVSAVLFSMIATAAADDYIIRDSGGNPLFTVNGTGEKQIQNGNLFLNGNSIVDNSGALTLDGGNVEVPNGNLDMGANNIVWSDRDSTGYSPNIATDGEDRLYLHGDQIRLRGDPSSSDDGLRITQTNDVEILNGNLNMDGNEIQNVGALELGWQNLTDYPAGCETDEAVQVVGDTLSCTALNPGGTVETGGGAQGQVAFFMDEENVTGSDNFYWNNSEVELGLGTNNPSAMLDVNGQTNMRNTLLMNGNDISNPGTVDGVHLDSTGNAIGIDGSNQYYVPSGAIGSSELASNAVTAGGNELDSSVAGNQIALNSGVLDIQEGAGSDLDADQLDGLDRDQFASNTRTFKLDSGSGTEYKKIGEMRQRDAEFKIEIVGAEDQGATNTRRVVAIGSKWSDTIEAEHYVYGDDNENIDVVLTETSNDANGDGYNDVYVYAEIDDFSQARFEIQTESSNSFTVDRVNGLSQSDLVGSIVFNSDDPASGTISAGDLKVGGTTDGVDVDNPGNGIIIDGSNRYAINSGSVDSGELAENSVTNTELANSDSFTMSGATIEGDAQVQGDLDVWGNIQNTNVTNLNVDGSILPPSGYDDTFDIGSNSRRWRQGHFSGTVNIDNGLDVTGGTVDIPAGEIQNNELANSAITVNANSGLVGGGTPSLGGSVGVSHEDTSGISNVDNSGGTIIQDLNFDGYGHVTGQTSYNLDNRYYTESESDSNFVDESGDTMTGDLRVNTDGSGGNNVHLKGSDGAVEISREGGNAYIDFKDSESDDYHVRLQNPDSSTLELQGGEFQLTGSNLDVSGNSINNFFGSNCQNDEVVESVNADGTYNCQSITGAADDTYVNEGGDTMTGPLDMNGNNINNANTVNASTLQINGDDITGLFVDETGDSMSGSLNMQGNHIDNANFLDFNSVGNIRTDGTNAINIDGNQNVEVPNGNIVLESGYDIRSMNPSRNIIRRQNGQTEVGDSNEPTELQGSSVDIPNGVLDMRNNYIVDTNDFYLDSQGATSFYDGTPSSPGNQLLEVNGGGDVGIPNGNLDVNGQLSVGSTQCSTGSYIDGDGTCTDVTQETQDVYVNENGDTMTGDLNMNYNAVQDVGELNVSTSSNQIAHFSDTGVEINQPLSLESSGPLSVANGIDLTGSSTNTIESYSTMYLTTSSGSPSDIVLDPTGDVGIDANASITGDLDMRSGAVNNVNSIDMNSVGDIRTDGTDAVRIDGNQNVAVPNGNLEMSEGQVIQDNDGEKRIEITASDTKIWGETGGATDPYLEIDDTDGKLVMGDGNVDIPNGNLDIGGNMIATSGNAHINVGDSGESFYIDTGDGAGNAQSTLNILDGGAVEIPNGNIQMGGNSVTNIGNSGGAISQSSGRTVLSTQGSGWAVYDSTNNQDITRFKEGGNVDIPNGDLDTLGNDINAGGGALRDVSGISASEGYSDHTISTPNLQNGQWQVMDEYNGQDIVRFKNGGTVEIPNGNLNVNGQLSVGSTQCNTGQYIDGDGTCTDVITETSDEYVNEGGDTMTGQLDMNGNPIVNIGSGNVDIDGSGAGNIQLNGNEIRGGSIAQSQNLVAGSYSTGSSSVDGGDVWVENDVEVGGDVVGSGADVAEKIQNESEMEPGTVVSISGNMSVDRTTGKHDTAVAGVVSTDPAMIMAKDRGGVPVAMTGTAPVKVTMENGKVMPGDMLTTSSEPGKAMKCNDMDRCEGSIIGKAMEPATKPGKVRMLISMG